MDFTNSRPADESTQGGIVWHFVKQYPDAPSHEELWSLLTKPTAVRLSIDNQHMMRLNIGRLFRVPDTHAECVAQDYAMYNQNVSEIIDTVNVLSEHKDVHSNAYWKSVLNKENISYVTGSYDADLMRFQRNKKSNGGLILLTRIF